MVARLVHKALAMHAIDMNEFAVVVLGKNFQHAKNLLCHPQPYPRLTDVIKADYWTMAKWLQKTLPGNDSSIVSRTRNGTVLLKLSCAK